MGFSQGSLNNLLMASNLFYYSSLLTSAYNLLNFDFFSRLD